MTLQQLSPHVYCYADTCNVYALRAADEAVLIDYGSGAIVPHLAQAGVSRIRDILMTHHHRDQGQGLTEPGVQIPNLELRKHVWAPHNEQDLFHSVEAHWQGRPVMNDYNMRQDRFSLLENVTLAGTLQDYRWYEFGQLVFTVWPTPGHTTGSITLLTTVDGQRLAFSGDLIAAPGQVWSLAATQWSYNGAEGVAATILSLLSLKEQQPDVLLPSHGEPIYDVQGAIDLLVYRLWELLQERRQNPRLFELRRRPFDVITAHLLLNRTSVSNSYVLRSESGKALFFDFGYDFCVGEAAGSDRASRRPWLYNIDALKAQHGISQIEAVIPTHYHDDHVAGLNLLRDVQGTEVWAAASFAPILEAPQAYNLPCLWYDPISVDRVLTPGQPLRWEEYELNLHSLPGHTRYAVAISLLVDGKKVLVTGDQYQGEDGLLWNYVYHNAFEIDDYVASAALYRRLAPDLILSGHWAPLWLTPSTDTTADYFDKLEAGGAKLARLHRELLPAETLGAGAEGFLASIQPYQATVTAGETVTFAVAVQNPLSAEATAELVLVTPRGWSVEPASQSVSLPANGRTNVAFSVSIPQVDIPSTGALRNRVAVEVTIGAHRWGQQAEALLTVIEPVPAPAR